MKSLFACAHLFYYAECSVHIHRSVYEVEVEIGQQQSNSITSLK